MQRTEGEEKGAATEVGALAKPRLEIGREQAARELPDGRLEVDAQAPPSQCRGGPTRSSTLFGGVVIGRARFTPAGSSRRRRNAQSGRRSQTPRVRSTLRESGQLAVA